MSSHGDGVPSTLATGVPPPAVLAALDAHLARAAVQDVRWVDDTLVALKLRAPGRTIHLAISLEPGAAGLAVLEQRPRRDADAEPGPAERLRSALRGAFVVGVTRASGVVDAASASGGILLALRRDAARGALHLATGPRPTLTAWPPEEGARAVRVPDARGADIADMPPELTARCEPDHASASDADHDRALAAWSERFLAHRALRRGARCARELAREAKGALKAARRRADARRGDVEKLGRPDPLRRQAEALAAHLHEVSRGDDLLRLDDWVGEGPLEIPLDPSLPPSAQLERLFHRVRRAERGRRRAEEGRDAALAEAEAIDHLRSEAGDVADALDALDAADERDASDALDERDAAEGVDERDAAEGVDERDALEAIDDRDTPTARALARLADLERRADALLRSQRKRRAVAERGRERDAPEALPYRRYRSADGIDLLVGRGAKQNDALTFGVARGNDLWLHARDAPGPHVIVRLPRGSEVPQETLLDAATLAHLGSGNAKAEQGDVAWTRVKHVRRAGAPGQVTFSHERTLRVRVEPKRVERLEAARLD